MSNFKSHDGILAEVVNKRITRRSFLKWSAAIGATASAAGLITQQRAPKAYAEYGEVSPNSISRVVDWVPTVCLVCHSWCALAVGKDADDCVRKIEGCGAQPKTGASDPANWVTPPANPEDLFYATGEWVDGAPVSLDMGVGYLPVFPNNRGRICAKGNTGMEHIYDPDRIKYPLLRMGERGEGKWRRLTWDQAINGDPDIYLDGRPWPGMAAVLRELGKARTRDPMGNARTLNEAGKDLRHRFVAHIGRSEKEAQGRFTGAYGTPNHVEHTSICEVSRHGAQIHRMMDKFPLPDHTTHGAIAPYFGATFTDRRVSDDLGSADDMDFHIEIGGNPCETKIPHTSYNIRWGDMRRRGTRLVCIDVRMGNTGAFADEHIEIIPGTDGALAAALFYEIGSIIPGALSPWQDLEADVFAGHLGPDAFDGTKKYVGLFIKDEVADGCGTGTHGPGAWGKSLERYVIGTNTVGPITDSAGNLIVLGAGTPASDPILGVTDPDPVTKTAAWAFGITGIPAADITYLARCLCGEPAMGEPEYLNASIDGYRGPAKHSNGHYNYALLRAVQTVAGKRPKALTPNGVVRGNIDRPGGLMHNAWTSHHNASAAGWGADPGGGASTPSPIAAYTQETAAGGTETQALWAWDYHVGDNKFKRVTHRVDQHLIPAIRASLGMDPYDRGKLATVNRYNTGGTLKLPYGGWVGGAWSGTPGYDPDFEVEVVFLSKNAPGNTRPNIQLDQELFTAKITEQVIEQGQYRLKHLWSYDIVMGDATRFCDLVLPSATFYEEYSSFVGETFALKGMVGFRQPVLKKNLYEAKTHYEFYYYLARAIDTGTDGYDTGGLGGALPWDNGASKRLFESFDWMAGGVAPFVPGGGDAPAVAGPPMNGYSREIAEEWFRIKAGNTGIFAPGIGAGTKDAQLRFIRTNGFYWFATEKANYYPRSGGAGVPLGDALFYHALIDATTDPSDPQLEPDGTFFGYPIYLPPRSNADPAGLGTTGGMSGGPVTTPQYPVHLTTYKLNVHTQSRTASIPRLSEVIGTCWAIMHPAPLSPDSEGEFALDYFGNTVRSGDRVEVVTNESTQMSVFEAKVTRKAQEGVVSISNSFGHEPTRVQVGGPLKYSPYDPMREATIKTLTEPEGAALGGGQSVYYVGGVMNREADADMYPSSADSDPVRGGGVNAYRRKYPPSAPQRGNHPNQAIARNYGGTGQRTCGNEATDALGGSMSFFSTKCRVVKVS